MKTGESVMVTRFGNSKERTQRCYYIILKPENESIVKESQGGTNKINFNVKVGRFSGIRERDGL